MTIPAGAELPKEAYEMPALRNTDGGSAVTQAGGNGEGQGDDEEDEEDDGDISDGDEMEE